MRILIIGEYSCFSTELKKGLTELGHQCTIFTWGEGRRKIKGGIDDYYFPDISKNVFLKLFTRIYQNMRLHRICRRLKSEGLYDLAIIVNPNFMRPIGMWQRKGVSKRMFNLLVNNCNKNILIACGDDLAYHCFVGNLRGKSNIFQSRATQREKEDFERVQSIVSYILPTHYDYAECYRNFQKIGQLKILKTIPLPIQTADYRSENTIEGNQITIFLGKMRADKGYEFMDKAVQYIIEKYPNVRRIPDRYLSIDEYYVELSKANIVIDQCTGFSYGMNALYAMAMGKCVLSNNEPECRAEYEVDYIPIVNIEPNVDSIVSQLSQLIETPSEILRLGKEAREFCEKHHDARIVAERLINSIK